MKKLILITLISVLSSGLFAQSKVGTTAANFLTIPVGAKAAGMGGAVVAMVDDASSLYWNPGAASRLQGNELLVSYTDWLVGTSYNYAGLIFKMDDESAIGISINQLDYGQEEITTATQPNGTGQKWDAQDIALGLTYARNLTDRFSIGGSVKYISQQIWNESATAYALDIGLLFITQLEGLKIGMNISNFGTEMKLDGKDLLQPVDIDPAQAGNNEKITATLNTDYWTLPLTFTVGVGYDLKIMEDVKTSFALDAIIPNNQSTHVNFGGEIVWNNLLSLRAGYGSIGKGSHEDGIFYEQSNLLTSGLYSIGAGVQYDFGAFSSKIDYSYNDFGLFKQISRVTLSVGF